MPLPDTKVDRFPYRSQWSGTKEITIITSGKGPLYVSAYRRYHDPEPEVRSEHFTITSLLRQNEREVSTIQGGQAATLEVKVRNEEATEYVLIEIPIPAACSYANGQPYRYQWESHRAYKKDRVAIFCDRLPPGEHRFEVKLEPRFPGRFILNPARAESMYAPVFYRQNALKKVTVY